MRFAARNSTAHRVETGARQNKLWIQFTVPALSTSSVVPLLYGSASNTPISCLQQVGKRHGEASRSLKVSQKYMSDHAPLTEAPASTPALAARQERRQMRRAGISLQIRLRSADFNDGNFEEVRTTLNASRKAI